MYIYICVCVYIYMYIYMYIYESAVWCLLPGCYGCCLFLACSFRRAFGSKTLLSKALVLLLGKNSYVWCGVLYFVCVCGLFCVCVWIRLCVCVD